MPYRTEKIQLFPKPEQEKRMLLNLHACRATYNDLNEYCRDCIDRYNEWRESMGVQEGDDASLYETETNSLPRFPSEFELTAKAGEFREINLWRRDAYGTAVREVGCRIYKAYQRWFDSLIDDPSAGKPRFRTDGRYDSFTYPAYEQYRLDTQGLFKGKKPRMFLGGVGWVRSSDDGIIKRVPVDCMKQAVISRKKMGKSNKWYITIFCECLEIPDNRTWYMDAETPDPVGLDLGARRVATLSDGTVVENHRTMRKNEKRMAKIQRKISKTEEGSEARRKYLGHLRHLQKRIDDSKNDVLQKATRSIVQNHTKIFVEDLSVKKLIELQDNKESRKLFRDASAGTFMRLLRYKGEETGSEIVPVDPAYTSRICTKCGRLNEPFSEETFHCRFCGFTKHRDDNACENLFRRGMGFDILGTSSIAGITEAEAEVHN